MDEKSRSVRISASGKVQAVGFRAAARKKGQELGLQVAPENQDDGSVVIEVSGPAEKIDQMIEWTQRGSALAQVEDVQVEELGGRRPSRGFA